MGKGMRKYHVWIQIGDWHTVEYTTSPHNYFHFIRWMCESVGFKTIEHVNPGNEEEGTQRHEGERPGGEKCLYRIARPAEVTTPLRTIKRSVYDELWKPETENPWRNS